MHDYGVHTLVTAMYSRRQNLAAPSPSPSCSPFLSLGLPLSSPVRDSPFYLLSEHPGVPCL